MVEPATDLNPCPHVTEHGDQPLHGVIAQTPLWSLTAREWSETGRGRPSQVTGASHSTCRHRSQARHTAPAVTGHRRVTQHLPPQVTGASHSTCRHRSQARHTASAVTGHRSHSTCRHRSQARHTAPAVTGHRRVTQHLPSQVTCHTTYPVTGHTM